MQGVGRASILVSETVANCVPSPSGAGSLSPDLDEPPLAVERAAAADDAESNDDYDDNTSDDAPDTSEDSEDEKIACLMGQFLSADLLAQLQTLPSTGWIAPPTPAGAAGSAAAYPSPYHVRGDSVGMRGRQRRQRTLDLVIDGQPKGKAMCECCGSASHVAWRRMIDALLSFRLDDWHLAQLRVVVNLQE